MTILGMGLGLSFGFASARQTEPNSEAASACPNQTDIGGKPKTFFFFARREGDHRRCSGRASVAGDEEMEDQVKMEETSTSNVAMLSGRGTFKTGTADGTVTQARDSEKRHRAPVNLSPRTC